MAANVNDDVVPDSVLSRMSRTLREVETLILNDERVLAKVKLDAVKVNLERVAAGLTVEMHDYLKECVNKLLDICQREEGDEHDVDDDHEASSNGSPRTRRSSTFEIEEDGRPRPLSSTSAHHDRAGAGGGVRNARASGRVSAASSSSNLRFSAPRVKSGTRGRPKVQITREQLLTLHKAGYTARKMAAHFQCSTSLVYKRMYEEDIRCRDKYSDITDEQLKVVIDDLQKQFPNSGAEMMHGLLQSRGLNLQRNRIRKCLSEVNPSAAAERWGNSVSRRVYKVSSPNSLWHMDGHMKLIRWGFVTNGCIDGYSRLVTFLHCSTSNNARTVFDLFLQATRTYGMPSRTRSDHGNENYLVAVFMNMTFGTNRGSHITGESVHNVRIERLWRDVFKDVIEVFYKEFYELEDTGVLDPSDEINRYSLHNVYLDTINHRLATFQQGWNNHRLRTEGNRTPEQIWRDGMLGCSLENSAVGRLFDGEPWEERIEEVLRRHNLTGNGDEREAVEETNDIGSRLSENQREELQHILAGEDVLKEKFCLYCRKVNEYLQS